MEAEKQTKENRKDVDTAFQKAGWLMIGSFLSGISGLIFFIYKRGRDAKDHFLVTFSQLVGELDRHPDDWRFYQESVPRVQEAVFRLRPFLRKPRRTDLSYLWNDYREARDTLQRMEDDKSWHESFETKFGCPKPKTRKEIIQLFFKKFAEIAE